MRLKNSFLLNILIALIIASSIVFSSSKGFLRRIELGGLDFLFRLRGALPYNPHIVIIEIDDENILRVGRWPWNRSWHAAVIKALNRLGAKYIYFDIIFSEKASEKEDRLLSEAIKEAGNIYLPFVFQEGSFELKEALFPIEEFSSYIKGTGSINISPDIDGSLRRVSLAFKRKDQIYYHVALKIAMDYLGYKQVHLKKNKLILSDDKPPIEIPLIEDNKMLINWQGRWEETFVHYSFLDILSAYKDILEGKNPQIDIKPLKGSICLVAVTAIGLYDIKPIPLQPEYPGVGVIANTISNILNRDFIKTVSPLMNFFVIYLMALIPALLISGKKPLRESLLTGLLWFLFFIVSFLCFKSRLWIEISLPSLSLFGSYLIVATYNFVRASIEKKTFFELAVTDELTRLYNIRYFKMILRAECLMARSEANKRFCIVMSDVDHFKHFNDTYGHQIGDLVLKEVASVLRSSVRSSDVVARYGGEEMIILLRGTSLDNAIEVAEKIRKNVETHIVRDENQNTYKVTISLGVASFKSQDNENTIIKRADEGLYKAKEEGRNRVCTIEG